MDMYERYETLCDEVKFQIKFLGDHYAMDFDYLMETLNEMKVLQDKIREQQFIDFNKNESNKGV